jgi:hypothetical protein
MSRSVSKAIFAAVLASVFVLVSAALYRGLPAQPDARQHLTDAVESPATLESPAALESLPEEDASMAAAFSFGVCAYTCDPCWHSDDCPLLGGYPQSCTWACY